MKYIDPIAAKNMTVTHRMMLHTLNQKCQERIVGFLTASQMTLGSQNVVGANPMAPKNPIRSASSTLVL